MVSSSSYAGDTPDHHHHQQQQQSSSSGQRSVSSRLHDVVSHIQNPETRSNLRESWDSLVKVMFAPCTGSDIIGGVPRDEALGGSSEQMTTVGGASFGKSSSPKSQSWKASVPFEILSQTSFQDGASFISKNQHYFPTQALNTTSYINNNRQSLVTTIPTTQSQQRVSPQEQRRAASRAKLRQLGAQHQLASGFVGESLADTARPISSAEEEREVVAAANAGAATAANGLAGGGGVDASSSSPELVDFDDGISAISSHTLEEMERRRLAKEKKNVVRVHPLDFSQIIDENTELKFVASLGIVSNHNYNNNSGGVFPVVEEEESTERNTEVVFGQPFYEQDETLFQNVRTVVDGVNGVAHAEFTPGPSNSNNNRIPSQQKGSTNTTSGRITPPPPPSSPPTAAAPSTTLHRVTSNKSSRTHQTLNTTVTEDSHEFEEMYKRHEAVYWTDSDRVASVEKSARGKSRGNNGGASAVVAVSGSTTNTRPSQRGMSIEERARRLRELSRSRSRSDGTSSSNKSATSSLVSGQHPHDTVPLYSSDLFSRSRKKSSSSNSGSRSRRSGGAGSRPVSVREESDPFSSLDYGEI